MILLDTTHMAVNGMNEITFTMKDVIYIVTLIAGGFFGWFKMQSDKQKMEFKIEILEKAAADTKTRLLEEALNAKAGRHALRKELTENVEKKELALHNKIEIVEKDAERSYEKLENKIDELRKEISKDTSAILEAIKTKYK